MCLTKFKKFRVPLNRKGIGKGWKVFDNRENGLYPIVYADNKPLPTNEWLNERDFRPWATENEENIRTYPKGFHIFRKKKGWLTTRPCEIRTRVYFKNVVATGVWVDDVIVAKDM